jgi:thiamine pyrophosphokinase
MDGQVDAIIVADGDVDVAALEGLAAQPGGWPMLIAADGGAARCLAVGLWPDVVVGDFDSLAGEVLDRLRGHGVEVRSASRDKDESDMELCLLLALARGLVRVAILGALGLVRPEHSLANVLLLADPRFDALRLRILGRGSVTWRVGTADGPAEAIVAGAAGDLVSLLPIDARVEGVRTEGLRFPLEDEVLTLGPARGLSNELLADRARVTARRGRLIVVHTDRLAAEAPATGHQED